MRTYDQQTRDALRRKRLPFLDHTETKDALLLAIAVCSLAGIALCRQFCHPLPLHRRVAAQIKARVAL